ncbi:atpG [Symbiodinium sp. KB8]|nr:atpG [Symbiodinium sp. KB8]
MQRKAHPIPPPRGNGLEREAVQTAWKAKELQREAGKVEARGAERLARIPGTFTTYHHHQHCSRVLPVVFRVVRFLVDHVRH